MFGKVVSVLHPKPFVVSLNIFRFFLGTAEKVRYDFHFLCSRERGKIVLSWMPEPKAFVIIAGEGDMFMHTVLASKKSFV